MFRSTSTIYSFICSKNMYLLLIWLIIDRAFGAHETSVVRTVTSDTFASSFPSSTFNLPTNSRNFYLCIEKKIKRFSHRNVKPKETRQHRSSSTCFRFLNSTQKKNGNMPFWFIWCRRNSYLSTKIYLVTFNIYLISEH